MGHNAMPMNMNMMGGQHSMGGRGGMPGFGLMNLEAEVNDKKATEAPKVETLNKKAEPKKETKKASKPAKKDVTEAHPGTKKVMEEISFEKPTWEDKSGYGWANLPFGAAYPAMEG